MRQPWLGLLILAGLLAACTRTPEVTLNTPPQGQVVLSPTPNGSMTDIPQPSATPVVDIATPTWIPTEPTFANVSTFPDPSGYTWTVVANGLTKPVDLADVLADAHAFAEQPHRAGDIEERLVERQRLDVRGERVEDLVDLSAHSRVVLVIARQEYRCGAQPAGRGGGHRRVHPVTAGLVRSRRDHTARSGATHHHRLAAQLRPSAQFHADEERVHVDVEDRARPRRVHDYSTRST